MEVIKLEIYFFTIMQVAHWLYITCMSDTIIEDSRTLPQWVHTASARDGSTSISVEPQESHFNPFLLPLTLPPPALIFVSFWLFADDIFSYFVYWSVESHFDVYQKLIRISCKRNHLYYDRYWNSRSQGSMLWFYCENVTLLMIYRLFPERHTRM